MLKTALRVLTPGADRDRLSGLWMPVGKSVVVIGRHAARLRARRVPDQEGPARGHRSRRPGPELGDGMTVDDLENLWPWLKQKGVTVWAPVDYLEIVNDRPQGADPGQRALRARGPARADAPRTGRRRGHHPPSSRRSSPRRARRRQRPGPRAHRGRRPRRRPGGIRDLSAWTPPAAHPELPEPAARPAASSRLLAWTTSPRAQRSCLAAFGLEDRIAPGDRVAIAVGSRGISDLVPLLATLVGAVRRAGGRPVPGALSWAATEERLRTGRRRYWPSSV